MHTTTRQQVAAVNECGPGRTSLHGMHPAYLTRMITSGLS